MADRSAWVPTPLYPGARRGADVRRFGGAARVGGASPRGASMASQEAYSAAVAAAAVEASVSLAEASGSSSAARRTGRTGAQERKSIALDRIGVEHGSSTVQAT